MKGCFFKKKYFFILFFAFFLIFGQKKTTFNDFYVNFNQKNTPVLKKNAFQAGETLKYKISYGRKNKRLGALPAANAQFSITDTVYNNKSAYFLNASGKTTKLFSLFMKVEHYYSSIIDTIRLNTIKYSMDIEEGKYIKNTQFIFPTDSINTQQNNDLLGLGYRLRKTENLQSRIGDTLFFTYHYEDQYYESYMKILGEEKIKTKFGKIKTLKLSPLLEKGRVFKSEKGALIWVSSDNMRIPLKIELPVLVGSIYVTLDSYENTLSDF